MSNLATQKQINYLMVAVRYSDIELPKKQEMRKGKLCNSTEYRFEEWLKTMTKSEASSWIQKMDTDDWDKQDLVMEEFETFIKENYA